MRQIGNIGDTILPLVKMKKKLPKMRKGTAMSERTETEIETAEIEAWAKKHIDARDAKLKSFKMPERWFKNHVIFLSLIHI